MRTVAALALLLIGPEPDLEQDYLATRDGSRLAMVTVICRRADGRPVRGTIQCAGYWFKHQDGEPVFYGSSLPFQTDSRGAIVMNPAVADEWMTCWCEDHGTRGEVTVEFAHDPAQVVEIVIGAN